MRSPPRANCKSRFAIRWSSPVPARSWSAAKSCVSSRRVLLLTARSSTLAKTVISRPSLSMPRVRRSGLRSSISPLVNFKPPSSPAVAPMTTCATNFSCCAQGKLCFPGHSNSSKRRRHRSSKVLAEWNGASKIGFFSAIMPSASFASSLASPNLRASGLTITRVRYYEQHDALVLDPVSVRNLELLTPIFTEESGRTSAPTTLIAALDVTVTGMGARLLRSWVLRPLIESEAIEARLDAVAQLVQQTVVRGEIRKELKGILDLERLTSRITLGLATPRELVALRKSLAQLPVLKKFLTPPPAGGSELLRHLNQEIDELADVRERLERAIADEPPALATDPGMIRSGYHAELDELRDLSQHSKQIIAAMEERERKRTNIGSLKIRFNQIFGYYIEISKANLHLVPAGYERKQTLVNAERFTSTELKEYERKILAADRGYSLPEFNSTGELLIIGGRHPVIEELLRQKGERFVPNDLCFEPGRQQLLLITGPNMGGKSTYLRQSALIVLMAQMGSFVPARQARLPVTDRIFTRIGASDNLARGRSTFLVEMSEVAAILNHATPASLVLLDEVGRGTATFDGLSIAWAVVEHLHRHTRARTLFATHYHEL